LVPIGGRLRIDGELSRPDRAVKFMLPE